MKKRWATLFLLCCIYSSATAQSDNSATKGVIDASHINLQENQTIALTGEWEFYWNKLLTSKHFESRGLRPGYIKVPSVWNGQFYKGEELDGQGFATYRLTVITSNAPKLLAIEIPNVYTSYKLFVNDELIATNGIVGETKQTYKPEWNPTLKVFNATDTLEIIVQVANFAHNRGGIHKPFVIGNFDSVASIRESKVIANMLLTGGLFALGCFFIAFYLFRAKQKSTIYFGLFCLLWAIRSVFSNIYLVSTFFDAFNWILALRIEYISLYLSVLFGILFLAKVFDPKESKLVKYAINIINAVFILLTLILPPVLFTMLLPAYQIFIVINLLFAVYVITKAVFDKRKDAWFSAISILLGVLVLGYEIISYVWVLKVNYVFLNFGYLTVFFLNSLVLASRFVGAYIKAERSANDNNSKDHTIRGKRLHI
ncbi:MAG: 7TM-DISM domain-containing protein [Fulvivirga sp.]